jgi:peptidoglycan/LPS O-acetylase OafA/YrhL
MLKKLTGPGLFRLFLALVVFVHHITRFAVGTSAVLIFFCLSGFWIYKMYLGRYSATRQPYLTYIVSRAWRLLPTFWLITVISILFLHFEGTLASSWSGANPVHFILSNLFIVGYNTLPMPPVGPAWSLDIEMQFYLIAPFIALFLARKMVPAVWVLLTVGLISLVSALLNNPVSLISYLAFFVLGMTAASTAWQPSFKLALASLGAGAVVIIGCMASPWRGILMSGGHLGPLAIYTPHANVVLALFAAPYAIYTTRQKGFSADGMFADLSYVIYLLHWIGAQLIRTHEGSISHKLVFVVEIWIAVIGLSLLIWKFYDHPINRMRSRWVNRRMKVAVAAVNPARSTSNA